MTIRLGRYAFDGPYISTDSLQDKSGVYAIHCKREGKYYLIDVGESASVKERVQTPDRRIAGRRIARLRSPTRLTTQPFAATHKR